MASDLKRKREDEQSDDEGPELDAEIAKVLFRGQISGYFH